MAVILAQALPEVSANRIFDEVLRTRPQAWPNLRILELGDAILRRRANSSLPLPDSTGPSSTGDNI
jgi:hypothetical protein